MVTQGWVKVSTHLPQNVPATTAGQLTRLREALAGCGAFLTAGRQADPLPILQDLASDWLRAEVVEIVVPAGSSLLEPSEPERICGPVLIGRRVIGRIEARRSWPFDADDRALLQPLGQLVGAALEHTMLQGQIEQYVHAARAHEATLENLLAFGRVVVHGASDPQALALEIAREVPAMVGGERASVLLLPLECPAQPLLALSNGHSASPERAREVAEHGLAGMVLRERAPLIIDETDTDRRWLGLKHGHSDAPTRCAMAVPLLWGARALGALTVTTTHSRRFNPAQLNLLELVACHVALAIQAANLQQRLMATATNLETLACDLEVTLGRARAGDPVALATLDGLAARLRAERAVLQTVLSR